MNTGWVGEIAPSRFMVPFTVVILGQIKGGRHIFLAVRRSAPSLLGGSGGIPGSV